MTAAPPRRVAAVLFALFVVASGGAFFVTQRLKRSTPIVTRVFFYQWIGPSCHCDKARVTVRFDANGTVRTGSTDGDGQFVFLSVPVGECTISVDAEGFKSYVQRYVQVTLGQLSGG